MTEQNCQKDNLLITWNLEAKKERVLRNRVGFLTLAKGRPNESTQQYEVKRVRSTYIHSYVGYIYKRRGSNDDDRL